MRPGPRPRGPDAGRRGGTRRSGAQSPAWSCSGPGGCARSRIDRLVPRRWTPWADSLGRRLLGALPCQTDVEDTCNRREAVRRSRPRAGASGLVHQGRGIPGRARARRHVGRRAPRPARRPRRVRRQFKKWRMADLPIVPERFKLVVRDERSKKQMNVVKHQLARDDIDLVINACDAGREGELIFAYLYEKSGSRKPVKRLWLNSMTKSAIEAAFARAAPRGRARPPGGGRPLPLGGRLDRRHERHPGRHHPSALVVRRRRLARPRADPDAGDPGPPRGGDPGVQARALLDRRRRLRPRARIVLGPTRAATTRAPTLG